MQIFLRQPVSAEKDECKQKNNERNEYVTVRLLVENCGKSQKIEEITENRGKPRKTAENRGKPQKIAENRGKRDLRVGLQEG
jgi:hypothetical protein